MIYARVSTDEQADRGYSLPSQLLACREYAARHGFEVLAEYADDYTGTVAIELRPEGRKAYAMLADGNADALIVYTVDRLVRPPLEGDEWDMPVLIRGLAKLGRDIHTVSRGQLKTDFASLLISMLDAKSAGDERRKIIERTGRGRLHKAKTGQVVGMGKAPYGYKYVKDTKDAAKTTMLAIDETQAAVVRMIFEWYTVGRDGSPIGAVLIARELIALGIPTPSEASGYKRKKTTVPGTWGNDSVFWILKSEVYKGVWRFGKFIGGGGRGGKRAIADTIAVEVPAIVSETTWQAAQAQRTKNCDFLRARGQRLYLLRGMIACSCGKHYHGSNRRYQCSSVTNIRRHYAGERCHEPSIKQEKLESAVWAEIRTIVTDPDQLEARLRAARAEAYDALKPKRDELATVEGLLRDTEAEAIDVADALTVAKGSKLVTVRLQAQAQEIDARYTKLNTRRDKLNAEINKATISDEDITSLAQFGEDAREGLDNPTPQQKQHWLELLKVRVEVKDGKVYMACLISQDGVLRVLELKEV